MDIRMEDKGRWEVRVPLVPDDVARVVCREGLHFTVQPSHVRDLQEDEYRQAGALIDHDSGDCPIALAIKEIPMDVFRPATVFFSHTVKGQPCDMAMLRRMMDLGREQADKGGRLPGTPASAATGGAGGGVEKGGDGMKATPTRQGVT